MTRRLLVFTFGSDVRFEGQLVGALERIEIGDAMRVLDGLFVAREPETGELSAICLSDLPPSRRTSRLLDFRLGDRTRGTATQQALDGAAGEAVRSLEARLQAGAAIAAVLVEHKREVVEDEALTGAVARLGGTEIADDLVDERRIADLTSHLVALLTRVT